MVLTGYFSSPIIITGILEQYHKKCMSGIIKVCIDVTFSHFSMNIFNHKL